MDSFASASVLFATQGQLLRSVGALQWGAQSSGHLKENHTLRRTYRFSVASREQHHSVEVWDFPALQVQGKSRHITQMQVKNYIEQGYKTPSSLSITCSFSSASLFKPATILSTGSRNAAFFHGTFPMVNLIKQPLKCVLARLYQGDLELLLNVSSSIPHKLAPEREQAVLFLLMWPLDEWGY